MFGPESYLIIDLNIKAINKSDQDALLPNDPRLRKVDKFEAPKIQRGMD